MYFNVNFKVCFFKINWSTFVGEWTLLLYKLRYFR